jgi:hypothetical protein
MNIYLGAFSVGSKSNHIPTPRLRSILMDSRVSACEGSLIRHDLHQGMIPIYKLKTSELYPNEKQYFSHLNGSDVYFCTKVSSGPIDIDHACSGGLEHLNRIFGLDPEDSEEICLRFASNIASKRVNHFCKTWDKCFHLLQSIIRVISSNEYKLKQHEKERFTLAWAKVLSTARIRFKLDCSIDVVDMGVSVPLWVQQFSKGVVILDTPNDITASAFASSTCHFLDNVYVTLKDLSITLCKSFLVKAKKSPEYAGYKSKIDEWIAICDEMKTGSANRRKDLSINLVFGFIGTLALIKHFANRRKINRSEKTAEKTIDDIVDGENYEETT